MWCIQLLMAVYHDMFVSVFSYLYIGLSVCEQVPPLGINALI